MQTIVTKYYPCTNHRGARITAVCNAGRVSLAWEYGTDAASNHRLACEALRAKLGWTQSNNYPPMLGGETATGYVWVFTCEPVTGN